MVEELLMKSKNHKTKFTPDGFTAELSSPDWAEGLLEVIKPERPYLHHLQGLIDTEAIAAHLLCGYRCYAGRVWVIWSFSSARVAR